MDVSTQRQLLRTDLAMPAFATENRLGGTIMVNGVATCGIFEFDPANERFSMMSRNGPNQPAESLEASIPEEVCFMQSTDPPHPRPKCFASMIAIGAPTLRRFVFRESGRSVLILRAGFLLTGHNHGVFRWPISIHERT